MLGDGTIVAQASAHGESSRGVIRLSGNEAIKSVAAFFVPCPSQLNSPFFSQNTLDLNALDLKNPFILVGKFRPWGNFTPLRQVNCILFYWPSGRGFTGEESVELHLPGSDPILNASIRTLCSAGQIRLAGKGEFTLRAFLNGRLDLTQAEAILGTIDSESEQELRNALKQLSGTLSKKFNKLRNRLLDVLSELEAGFDFIEEDIEFISSSQIHSSLLETISELEQALSTAQTQLSSDQKPRVVLVGRPNVGKSSLFNKLTEVFQGKASGKAIVSAVAGTTRDYLEAELSINGAPFTLTDVAGIEREILPDQTLFVNLDEENTIQSSSPRERAQYALDSIISQAALVIICYDTPQAKEKLFKELESFHLESTLEVVTKCDKQAFEKTVSQQMNNRAHHISSSLLTSSKTGMGIEELGKMIVQRLSSNVKEGDIVSSTALRCQESLRGARQALINALFLLENETLCDESLLASEVRLALNQIGLITGEVHTDDLLDRIFNRFCIGK